MWCAPGDSDGRGHCARKKGGVRLPNDAGTPAQSVVVPSAKSTVPVGSSEPSVEATVAVSVPPLAVSSVVDATSGGATRKSTVPAM